MNHTDDQLNLERELAAATARAESKHKSWMSELQRLAAVTAERDEATSEMSRYREAYDIACDERGKLRASLAAVTADLKFRRELGALQQQEYDKVIAERDVLRADLCTFAVDMEKQLSAVTAERDALKADRETELFQMAGYLSAELPALHSVEAGEIMRAVDAWIKREAKDAKLAKEGK